MSYCILKVPRTFDRVVKERHLDRSDDIDLGDCRYCYRRGHTHGRIAALEENIRPLRAMLDRLEVELKRIRRELENNP